MRYRLPMSFNLNWKIVHVSPCVLLEQDLKLSLPLISSEPIQETQSLLAPIKEDLFLFLAQ